MASNVLAPSLLVLLFSATCCLAAPMCQQTVEPSAIQYLMAGLRVVDNISVNHVNSLMLFPTSNNSNFSIAEEEPEVALPDTATTAFDALEIMCEQHGRLRILWDSPLARQDASLTTIRLFGQQLLRPMCEWVQILFTIQYPTSSFSLSCHSDQEIAKICHAHSTVSFSETLNSAISAYNDREGNSEDRVENGVWIDKNLSPDNILPDVYQLISSTR